MRNPHAGQLFTSSDEQIADALLDVSIPTLMLSLVHMSADPTLIRGALKPAGLFLNEVQGYMSDEDKSAVRKIALEVIADYRDRGCPEPEPVGPALLKEMMEWLVCEPVPDEYVPMLLEEMELDGVDERAGKPLPLSVFWLHAHVASPCGVWVLASPLRAPRGRGLTEAPPAPGNPASTPWPVPTVVVGPGTDGAVALTGPQLAGSGQSRRLRAAL